MIMASKRVLLGVRFLWAQQALRRTVRTFTSRHNFNVSLGAPGLRINSSRWYHCVYSVRSADLISTAAISRSLSLSTSSEVSLNIDNASVAYPHHVYTTESIVYPTWQANSDIKIDKVDISPLGDKLIVTLGEEGIEDRNYYPSVWLRDNCRCGNCFNPDSKSRTNRIVDLDIKCKLNDAVPDNNSKSVIVTWSDGHVSQYPSAWLRCNAFSASDPDPITDLQPHLWDAATCRERIRYFDFGHLMNDDRALFEMFTDVKVLGLAVIKNTPLKLGQLHRLAERVGYLLPCNYGETFQVKAKVDPSNAAYTTGDLALHTDLTYFNQTPGIQMLHCIKQADGIGGENTLVDGFKVAGDLRLRASELFDILTKESIEFYDSGTDTVGEFYQLARHRIIRLDPHSNVERIIFSDHGRSAISRVHVDDVVMVYKALKAYATLLYKPTNVFEYRMNDGDILIMDNYRVLHGRNAFTMKSGTSRHLEGSYVMWDNVMSKLRVLKKQLDEKRT